MGTEPIRVKGHLTAQTMIQRDRVPDSTKLVYLAVILTIAILSAWSSQAGHKTHTNYAPVNGVDQLLIRAGS